MTDIRHSIISTLTSFTDRPLRAAAVGFFGILGYRSERTLPFDTVAALKDHLDPNGFLREENAHLSLWKSVHLIFQLTKSELAPSAGNDLGLILDTPFELRRDGKVIESYIFFALDLHPRPDGQPHNREIYGNITRALNRLVPQPVLVLFREDSRLSIAVINRRRNLRDGTRDVLTRVSLIRDIDLHSPHRAHLDLLQRFSLPSLSAEAAIRTFNDLDTAWQKIFSVQELKDSFYKSLSAWFRWAINEIQLAQLPDQTPDTAKNRDRATQEFTVRLICRTLFTWFIKEMRLIPAELLELYDTAENRRVLTKDGDSRTFLEGNHYYRGILQNIFFQSLNRPMDQRRKSGTEATNDREVTNPDLKKLAYIGKQNLPENFDYSLFDRIPYLNGGLFDSLPEDNLKFTHEEGNAFKVPNKLFYARREDGYALAAEGGRGSRPQPMEGLNRIFDRYRFTVAENTPLEEDVALDPELLGLVFENLLAEIDPDDEAAAKSARKASGSYYTPRRIVDYMVNEALHLHLRTEFEKKGATPADLQLLSQLCYELDPHADFSPIAARVVDALEAVRVLDPACGSGAFPMGMLHRMVELLRAVDPRADLWKERLLSRIPAVFRAQIALEMQGKSYNYLRKLGLIQKNLYGLDIQPLATLIAKLRFFLTLIVEQEVHLADPAHNYGLSSLPNLETNLICANTLADTGHGLLSGPVLADLRQAREEYYQPATTRARRDELAASIGEKLAGLFPGFAEKAKGVKPAGATPMDLENMRRRQDAYWLAEWFKHATIAAPFFNVETFFPELVGDGGNRHPAPFHIVIGNPPYGGTKIEEDVKTALGLGSKDPYGAFIARFLGDPARSTPLAEGGVLSYIVSDTFMTIKTHRPLREQMLRHRVHKMIRVSGDTFKATVNCAVILCQRGAASETQTCQMADLTNVSIWDQHERFLHLLYQTEGFTRRANISNQTYAIYHYRQNLITTNSNLPFFVASPKLFALMNDTTASVQHENIGGKRVPVRTVTLNGNAVRLMKLGDIAEVKQGLATGDNDNYLFQNPDARGSYRSIEDYNAYLLSHDDLERIRADEELRNEIILRGISTSDTKSPRYFEGKYIVPYDKGGEGDAEGGWLPKYLLPTEYFIDWSDSSVKALRSDTIADVYRRQRKAVPNGKSNYNRTLASALRNQDFYFRRGITFSHTGMYSPTFRESGSALFDMAGSTLFLEGISPDDVIGTLNSRLWISLFRNYVNATVNTSEDPIKDVPLPLNISAAASEAVRSIFSQQARERRYDYTCNEQLEIDRLVYAAYGLNDGDIKEVENWYARRYSKLADAQRRNLAAKQGKTEEQLLARQVLHFYCDESCHLPSDGEPNMLLGLLACPTEQVATAHAALRAIATSGGFEPHFEAKWTKLSPARLPHYLALLEWFFAPEQESLSFRGLVLPDKARLYAALPETARDHLYYRLYYQLLRSAIEPENRHRIFLDTKDTRGGQKIAKLRDLLQLDAGDSLQTAKAIRDIQLVRSHEIGLLQLTDLFLGAIAYARRGSQTSPAKLAFIRVLEEKIGSPLTADTPPGSAKFIITTEHDQDALLL
jgi:hypothetical protein